MSSSPASAGAVAAPVSGGRLGAKVRADAARVFFILAALGSVSSPPVANIGAALCLIAFFTLPDALGCLRAAVRRPIGIGALALLVTMGVAMLWADAEWARRFAAWWSWRPLLLLIVGTALFEQARWQERFALVMVAALAMATVASFIVRLLPNPVVIDDPGIILRNHTTQGMALVVGVVLAGVLAWGRPASRRRRLLLVGAIVLFVANIAVIATGRSAHLALLCGAALGAYSLLQGRRRWWVLLLVPLVGGALLASSSMVRERFTVAYDELGTAMSSPQETSMGLRVIIWSTTRELIERRPLLGYGVGGFAPAYAQLVHQRYTGWQAAEAKDTHNQYLHVWVEAGIPGLLAFLAFVVGVLRQAAATPYRGAGVALFAAWLLTSLFNSHFQTFAEAHLIGLTLGVLFAGRDADQSSRKALATAPATSV